MAKRVCYIHIGPTKTGTTAIQWFLKENRAELLKLGYFVPESDAPRGAHHDLVRRLCGQEMPHHGQSAAAKFARELMETPSEAVLISSEALEGLLRNRNYATTFFERIHELNLEPKLVLFPRNQPQWINSRYSSQIKTFRRSESFHAFALGIAPRGAVRFSPWLDLANAHAAKLVARPFTSETISRGVVPEFLLAIGVNAVQFRDAHMRLNEAAGPFTVSLARGVSRQIGSTGKPLTYLQAMQCKTGDIPR